MNDIRDKLLLVKDIHGDEIILRKEYLPTVSQFDLKENTLFYQARQSVLKYREKWLVLIIGRNWEGESQEMFLHYSFDPLLAVSQQATSASKKAGFEEGYIFFFPRYILREEVLGKIGHLKTIAYHMNQQKLSSI